MSNNNTAVREALEAAVARKKADGETLQALLDNSEMSETTEESVDDGPHFEMIEGLLEDLNQVEGSKTNVMASIAWSYAFRVGRLCLQLLDLDASLAMAEEYENQARKEALLVQQERLEDMLQKASDIYHWAATQTRPDLLPTDKQVAMDIGKERPIDKDEIAAFAEDMDISLAESEKLLKLANVDAGKLADKYKDQLHTAVLPYLAHRTVHAGFQISDWDAVVIVEKIGMKAEVYYEKAELRAARTRMRRIRRELRANMEIFEAVADKAAELSDRLRAEAEAGRAKAGETEYDRDSGTRPQLA